MSYSNNLDSLMARDFMIIAFITKTHCTQIAHFFYLIYYHLNELFIFFVACFK